MPGQVRDAMRPVHGNRLIEFAAVAVVVLAGFATSMIHRCGTDVGVTPAFERGSTRELEFSLLNGGMWRLSEERDHVVAVNLWATWCGPCRAETPMLVRAAADLGPEGFRVLGVSLDTVADKEVRVRSFRTAYNVTYAMAFPGALSQIDAGLEVIPTTLLFDRKGRAAKIYVGEIEERTLRADVAQLLREP